MSCGRRLVPWIIGALVATYAPALSAQALISGLDDLQLGRWNGISDMQGEVDHCVYARRGGRFSVAATGVGSGGAFVLRNGPGTLPFRVDYNDGGGWSQLNPGVPLSGQRAPTKPVRALPRRSAAARTGARAHPGARPGGRPGRELRRLTDPADHAGMTCVGVER